MFKKKRGAIELWSLVYCMCVVSCACVRCVYVNVGTSRIKEAKSRKSRSWIHGSCICGLITAETSPNWNICMISGTIAMYI